MVGEVEFWSKVLTMIEGEVAQVENVAVNSRMNDINLSYARGERSRLLQMKRIINDRLKALEEDGDWSERSKTNDKRRYSVHEESGKEY